MKLGLLILTGGKNAQACRNIVFFFFFYCAVLAIRDAFMFYIFTHFLSYLTLWASVRSVEQPFKCEANTCSHNVPSLSLTLILDE